VSYGPRVFDHVVGDCKRSSHLKVDLKQHGPLEFDVGLTTLLVRPEQHEYKFKKSEIP